VSQINTAVTQMSKVTQQNASSSEELAATAEEMNGQAEHLRQLMASLIGTTERPRTYAAKASGKSRASAAYPAVRHNKTTHGAQGADLDESEFGKF
jgi:methyl-accepting chemotaxis protein